jgi:small conductance mechanosensitive channel
MVFAECSAQAPADRRRTRRHAFIMLLCLLSIGVSILTAAGSAFAQSPLTTSAPAPDPKEIGRLVDSLENPAKREELLDQLKALQQVEQAAKPERDTERLGTRLLTVLSARLDNLGEEVRTTGEVVLAAPQGMRWLQRQALDPA